MTMRATIMGALFLGCVTVGAGAPAEPTVDATAAFARLKTLAGEWEADTSMGKSRVTYEVVADGTAVLERETAEKMPTMVTMYHIDGGRVLLTHYCMAGNQPRMQARQFDANTGALKFEFLDATNLANAAAGHMHNVSLRFLDRDHLVTQWEFYENGKPTFAEEFRYTRVR
jgi:hypothetical protein